MATLVSDTSSSDSDDLDADEAAQEQVCAVRQVQLLQEGEARDTSST
eukprot:gene24959-30437_t